MRLLEKFKLFRRSGSQNRPQSAMDRFEITGLHEISSTIEFRRDNITSLMVLFFLALSLFLLVSLWVGTFSKQETMRGIVLGTNGGERITATIGGTISKIWVEQNQMVEPGQRLVTIVPPQTGAGNTSLSKNDLQALIDQRKNAKEQIEEVRQLLARDDEDLKVFESTLDETEKSLKEQEAELKLALAEQKKTVTKLHEYLKVGYTTQESVTGQERTLQDYRRQLADVRVQAAQLRANRIERRRAVHQNKTSVEAQLSQLTRLVSEMNARIERARTLVASDVLTVTKGQLVALNVREGTEVQAGDAIGAIGDPEAPFTIGLTAPSKTTGLLTIGQRVVLKYDAFPFKTFGVKHGRIISIGKQPITVPTKEQEQQMAAMNPALLQAAKQPPPQSNFMVEVEPEDKTIMAYGVERPILVGSTLTADVIVERRRLIDWVLDPIRALRGRT